MHIPNVGMLVIGVESAVVATGVVADTVGVGTIRLAGVVPMLQAIVVPSVTSCGIW
jgi:hypothetical protein